MSNSANAIQQLIIAKEKAKENEIAWKAEGKRIDAQLAEIIKPEEYLEQAGKMATGGSTTVIKDGAKFSLEASKEIKWDSKKLQSLAANMPWNVVSTLFKITFSVPEALYKQLPAMVHAGSFPEELLKEIDVARTVSIGEAKIKTAEIVVK